MTPSQIEKLIKTLRANGVTHFKSKEFEIKFKELEVYPSSKIAEVSAKSERTNQSHAPAVASSTKTAAGAPPLLPVDANIPHRETLVSSLLKLNDEQLVDKLFPEGQDPYQIPQPNGEH